MSVSYAQRLVDAGRFTTLLAIRKGLYQGKVETIRDQSCIVGELDVNYEEACRQMVTPRNDRDYNATAQEQVLCMLGA